jgi:hypothetical protein
VIQAFQAGSERRGIEIHEEPRRISSELQVCDHLREVNGMQMVDDLQLNDDAAVDQQVQLEPAADAVPFVVE